MEEGNADVVLLGTLYTIDNEYQVGGYVQLKFVELAGSWRFDKKNKKTSTATMHPPRRKAKIEMKIIIQSCPNHVYYHVPYNYISRLAADIIMNKQKQKKTKNRNNYFNSVT